MMTCPYAHPCHQCSYWVWEREMYTSGVSPKRATARLLLHCSGIPRLGHTGIHALATRGHAPPVQVCMWFIGADSIVVNHEAGAKRSWNWLAQYCYVYIHRITSLVREFAVSDLHCTTVWPQNPTWEAVKFKNFSAGAPPPTASALCEEVRTNVVCPCCSLASVMSLAIPLLQKDHHQQGFVPFLPTCKVRVGAVGQLRFLSQSYFVKLIFLSMQATYCMNIYKTANIWA